jgi:hypothetical protein
VHWQTKTRAPPIPARRTLYPTLPPWYPPRGPTATAPAPDTGQAEHAQTVALAEHDKVRAENAELKARLHSLTETAHAETTRLGAEVKALTDRVVAAENKALSEARARRIDGLITSGAMTPADRDWATKLHEVSPELFEGRYGKAEPNSAWDTRQAPPSAPPTPAPSREEAAVAAVHAYCDTHGLDKVRDFNRAFNAVAKANPALFEGVWGGSREVVE